MRESIPMHRLRSVISDQDREIRRLQANNECLRDNNEYFIVELKVLLDQIMARAALLAERDKP